MGIFNTDAGMFDTDAGTLNADSGTFGGDAGMFKVDVGMFRADVGAFNIYLGTFGTCNHKYWCNSADVTAVNIDINMCAKPDTNTKEDDSAELIHFNKSTSPEVMAEKHHKLAKFIREHQKHLQNKQVLLTGSKAASTIYDLKALHNFNDIFLLLRDGFMLGGKFADA